MKCLSEIGSSNTCVWLALSVLRLVGYLVPDQLTELQRRIRPFYVMLWFMFIVGIMMIAQIGDLVRIWGNVPLMVETSYLLFTYFVHVFKIINVVIHRKAIFDVVREGDEELNMEERAEGKAIVERSNRDTKILLYTVFLFCCGSAFSWGATEDRELLFRAWYPFDVTKTPAYEVAYVHQSLAVMVLALTNLSLGALEVSLVGVCRCRLSLLKLSLRTLFQDVNVDVKHLISKEDDNMVSERLRVCIQKHQIVLEATTKIESCFTYSILALFTVSIVVLCVSAYQLGEIELDNEFRVVFMFTYLIGMVIQVFVYCYQGHHLSEESLEVADTVYELPWYLCSIPLRRSLLVMMARSRRAAEMTAGGFVTLSLGCFMSIIKVSYSFLTVLQQVDE
uniref:Odorant receptor n=1 Tax=Dendrolimus punctatus TaxID=238572 RepID=A0A2K8GKU0_9NEOP|nr:Odorant Receptor 22 [Dendrolimus punctatus]